MIRSLCTRLPLVIAVAACQPTSFAPPPRKADLGKGMIVGPAAAEKTPEKAGECWAENKAQVVPVTSKAATTKTASAKAASAPGKAGTIRFRVPCPGVMTPEFTASLQRALQARGFHDGAITGRMDAATQAAVRRYQKSLGLDLPVLTLAAAQSLGLVATELDAL